MKTKPCRRRSQDGQGRKDDEGRRRRQARKEKRSARTRRKRIKRRRPTSPKKPPRLRCAASEKKSDMSQKTSTSSSGCSRSITRAPMKVGLSDSLAAGRPACFTRSRRNSPKSGHSGKGHGQTHFAVVSCPDQSYPRCSITIAPRNRDERRWSSSMQWRLRGSRSRLRCVGTCGDARSRCAGPGGCGFRAADGMAADPLGELTDLATEMRVSDLAVLIADSHGCKKNRPSRVKRAAASTS